MAVEYQAKVGLQANATGSETILRSDKTGAQVVNFGSGKYAEAVLSGNVFSLTLNGATTAISAGNLVAAAAAASTQFAVWNPIGSGKNLILLKFAIAVVSGTSPVTGIYHSYSSTAPSIATSVVNPIQNNLVGTAGACAAKALTHVSGSALTGSTALQIIRQADLAMSAGTFASLAPYHAIEYIDGDIIIPPGICWVPTWKAAGTSMLVDYSVTWQEVAQ